MRYWKKCKTQALCLLLFSQSAWADFEIVSGACDLQAHRLNVQAKIELAPSPIEALQSGIGLYFVYEIEQTGLEFGATWWGDFQSHQVRYELYYNPIAQTYRLSGQGKEHHYQSLEHALADLGQFSSSYLAPEQSALEAPHEIRVRLSFDTTHLPTSLRLTSLISPQWNQQHSNWWYCPPTSPS